MILRYLEKSFPLMSYRLYGYSVNISLTKSCNSCSAENICMQYGGPLRLILSDVNNISSMMCINLGLDEVNITSLFEKSLIVNGVNK